MRNVVKNLLLSFSLMSLIGCNSLKLRDQIGIELTGDEIITASDDQAGLALMLGPGSVRAFSHAGFLQVMEQNKIPIKAIYGIEWGALVGGAFVATGSASKVQWLLQKVKPQDLPSLGFISKSYDAISAQKFLSETLPRQILMTSIPVEGPEFSCPVINSFSGNVASLIQGPLKSILSQCVVSMPLLKPYRGKMANMLIDEEQVKNLFQQHKVKYVVYVNVLADPYLFSQTEMRNHPLESLVWNQVVSLNSQTLKALKAKYNNFIIVNVDTQNQPLFSLKNSNVLFLSGQRAAKQLLNELDY